MTCERCDNTLSEQNAYRRSGNLCQHCTASFIGKKMRGPYPQFKGPIIAKRRSGLRLMKTILKGLP